MSAYYGPPQNLPHTFRCQTHPDREGVGICVNCRAVVCVECTTKIDRMNYCIRCLQSATAPVREANRDNRTRDTLLGIPLLIGSFVVAAGLFALFGLLLAMMRHGAAGGVTGG
jgi:hypothetical protein